MSSNTETAAPAVAAAGEQAKAATPAKSKLPLIIILVVVLALGGGVFFYLKKANASTDGKDGKAAKESKEKASKEETSEKAESHEDSEEEEEGSSEGEGKKAPSLALLLPKDKSVKQVIELQPFILNLADETENRYLRLAVSLGVDTAEKAEKPDPLFTARLRNALLAVLMTKTSEDLLTVEGKVNLRKELLKAAKKAVSEPEIKAIYITELIVQK
jgi:flagellar FliL protein